MKEFVRIVRVWATKLSSRLSDDGGVTSIEYALIAGLIAMVIVGAVTTVGDELLASYQYIANCVINLSCS